MEMVKRSTENSDRSPFPCALHERRITLSHGYSLHSFGNWEARRQIRVYDEANNNLQLQAQPWNCTMVNVGHRNYF